MIRKLRSGMSLIELMVVMAIFAAISTIGLNSVVEFKAGTELSSASQYFEKTISTTRNSARNKVVSKTNPAVFDPNNLDNIFDNQFAGYLAYFDNGKVSIYSCLKIATSGGLNCGTFESESNLVNITIVAKPFIAGNPNICSGIFFEGGNGKIKIINNVDSSLLSNIQDVNINLISDCEVDIVHANRPDSPIKYLFNHSDNVFKKI